MPFQPYISVIALRGRRSSKVAAHVLAVPAIVTVVNTSKQETSTNETVKDMVGIDTCCFDILQGT